MVYQYFALLNEGRLCVLSSNVCVACIHQLYRPIYAEAALRTSREEEGGHDPPVMAKTPLAEFMKGLTSGFSVTYLSAKRNPDNPLLAPHSREQRCWEPKGS